MEEDCRLEGAWHSDPLIQRDSTAGGVPEKDGGEHVRMRFIDGFLKSACKTVACKT